MRVPPPTVLITTAEAARRLGVSRVRNLEGFRIEGRRHHYVRADLGGDVAESDRLLVSVKSAARQLGVSTVTVHNWIGSGRLESFRVEEERRIYVDSWLMGLDTPA